MEGNEAHKEPRVDATAPRIRETAQRLCSSSCDIPQ